MAVDFGGIFDGLTVMVTGHTGFKGAWLSIWLRELGARVVGFSLEPPTSPSLFELAKLGGKVIDERGDVRDISALRRTIETYRPSLIFHLAARPIVLVSYREPKPTFDVNVGGTVNLLEAVRGTSAVRAVVCVTSDKCYSSQDWVWSYRENDPLGGHDPYSASKAMAEVAIASYRLSYFSHGAGSEVRATGDAKAVPAVASVRAGNVIGGGDWPPFRLVPDCMRALMAGHEIGLRNPHHVRPWQHVLEPLSGYLLLASKLLSDEGQHFADAWNLGPHPSSAVSAEELVQKIAALWGEGSHGTVDSLMAKETTSLTLNWDKASRLLAWRPIYSLDEALAATVDWYAAYARPADGDEPADMYSFCVRQLTAFTQRARELRLCWACPEP